MIRRDTFHIGPIQTCISVLHFLGLVLLFRLDEIFRQIQWAYSRHKTQKARQHALLSMTIAFLHGREISSPNQTNQLQQTLSCTVASLNKATLGIAAAAYERGGTCQRDMPRRGRGLHARGGRATCPGAKCPAVRTCQCYMSKENRGGEG